MTDNELSMEKRRYSPRETALIKFRTVSEIVAAQAEIMKRAPTKIPLNDLPAIQQAANDYMEHCAALGVIPSMLTFSAAIGHSRRNVYDFVERHRDSPTADFFDSLRSLWNGIRVSAVDRGAAAESLAIFLLKNSGQGLTDAREIEIHPPESPLDIGNAAEVRRKYLDSLPEEDE